MFQQSADIENHVIHTINRDLVPEYTPLRLKGATTERVFYYSSHWNFYYTCEQLAKLLPDEDAVIAAHDWLELGMVSNLGLQNPVVQFVHGDYDYYYNLAERHAKSIDCFICVSGSIADNLKKRMPEREADIHYLRYPVPEIKNTREVFQSLQLVFAGRCEEAKGYHLLPWIDDALQQRNIHAHWHIAGPGSDSPESQQQWKNANVTFHGLLSQEKINVLLTLSAAFILPSFAEGMPVSVVEAMKAGAIPVVNDLNGGLQELITNDVTGYLIPNNDPEIFAERISEIFADSEKRKKISSAAIDFANLHFNPIQNSKLIEDLIIHTCGHSKKKKAFKTTGSKLDQPWLPNFITQSIRTILQ